MDFNNTLAGPVYMPATNVICQSDGVHSRIQQCRALQASLAVENLSLSSKLRFYNTCILRIFLYGSECWAITKEDARRIYALQSPSMVSSVYVCLMASSGITSSPMMKFDIRPTNLYLQKLSRHGV